VVVYSLVRSVPLDLWSQAQVDQMKYGGNRRWRLYREYQRIPSGIPASQLYGSPAGMAYKKGGRIPYMGFPPSPTRWDGSTRSPFVPPPLPPGQPSFWTRSFGDDDNDDYDFGSFVSGKAAASPKVSSSSSSSTLTSVEVKVASGDDTATFLKQLAVEDAKAATSASSTNSGISIHMAMTRTLRTSLNECMNNYLLPDICAIIALYLAPQLSWKVNDDIDFHVPVCYLQASNRLLWKEAYIKAVLCVALHSFFFIPCGLLM
jgi:hypothetical protein